MLRAYTYLCVWYKQANYVKMVKKKIKINGEKMSREQTAIQIPKNGLLRKISRLCSYWKCCTLRKKNASRSYKNYKICKISTQSSMSHLRLYFHKAEDRLSYMSGFNNIYNQCQ